MAKTTAKAKTVKTKKNIGHPAPISPENMAKMKAHYAKTIAGMEASLKNCKKGTPQYDALAKTLELAKKYVAKVTA